mmetsp:Transcript_76775/g.197730  ORF Transcript_76775/g.197730 Transcript_76775/m.197730 type:complete len:222 (-) Transcript_76775:343-1008(-)
MLQRIHGRVEHRVEGALQLQVLRVLVLLHKGGELQPLAARVRPHEHAVRDAVLRHTSDQEAAVQVVVLVVHAGEQDPTPPAVRERGDARVHDAASAGLVDRVVADGQHGERLRTTCLRIRITAGRQLPGRRLHLQLRGEWAARGGRPRWQRPGLRARLGRLRRRRLRGAELLAQLAYDLILGLDDLLHHLRLTQLGAQHADDPIFRGDHAAQLAHLGLLSA